MVVIFFFFFWTLRKYENINTLKHMDLVDHISFEFEFVDISDLLCVK